MLEAMMHFAVEPFAAYFALGRVPGSSDRPRLAQAYILRTADGGLITIHLSSLEKFWQGLATAIFACGSPKRVSALCDFTSVAATCAAVTSSQALRIDMCRAMKKIRRFRTVNIVSVSGLFVIFARAVV